MDNELREIIQGLQTEIAELRGKSEGIYSKVRTIWKATPMWVKILIVIAGIGIGVAYRYYGGPSDSDEYTDAQQAIDTIQAQVADLQFGISEILAVPEQVRKEVRHNVQTVVHEIADYSVADRVAELERISRLGGEVRSGRYDNPSEGTDISALGN